MSINDLTSYNKVTSITSEDSAVTIGNYSQYIVKAGWCYFQLFFTVSDTSQHYLETKFPNPTTGNYAYFNGIYQSTNIQIRIDRNGVVRLQAGTPDIQIAFTGVYPIVNSPLPS